MKQNHRAKLNYYKQLYVFESCFAELAHPSWTKGLTIPAKIAKDDKQKQAFLSQMMVSDFASLPHSEKNFPVLTLISSLPKTKLNRFFRYLFLAFIKNDRSLLINGIKLKELKSFFSKDDLEFLTQEKDVKLNLKHPFIFPKELKINETNFLEICFQLLSSFFSSENNATFQRFKMRFPKEFSENPNTYFHLFIKASDNIDLLNLMTEALFSDIYSIFQTENENKYSQPAF